MSITALIDHTLLAPDATVQHIRSLYREAVNHDFYSPTRVRLAAVELAGYAPRVCAVAGFLSDARASETRAIEAKTAISDGTNEVDIVINVGAVKDSDGGPVESDKPTVVDAAGKTIVKVLFENSELTDKKNVRACQAVERYGAYFVKTSTGTSEHGATAHAVSLMRRTVGDRPGGQDIRRYSYSRGRGDDARSRRHPYQCVRRSLRPRR